MAYKTSTDPDIMYMHEAMREKDKEQFILTMQKKVEDQMSKELFSRYLSCPRSWRGKTARAQEYSKKIYPHPHKQKINNLKEIKKLFSWYVVQI